MKNTYLIAYDISEDKLRTKTAAKLLYFGLMRVQKSVFIGSISPQHLAKFTLWFQQKVLTLAAPDDSLIILPLLQTHITEITIFGKNDLDIDRLIDKKHTLIF